MRSASAKPAVVTSTTGSPLRVSSALVATVVPTLTALTAAAPPSCASSACAAFSPGSPPPGLGGTDNTLRTCSAPAGETAITSVKVPPRSIQNSQPARRCGCGGAWLTVSIACIIRACDPTAQPLRSRHAGSRDLPPRGVLAWPGGRAVGPQDLGAGGGRARRRLRGPLGGLSRCGRAACACLAAGRLLQGTGGRSGAGGLEPGRLRCGGVRLAPARPRRVPHGAGALPAGVAGAARGAARLSGNGGAWLAG